MLLAPDQTTLRPSAEQTLPAFVTRRMDEHHIARLQQLWGGEHVHVWTQPPAPTALMLVDNDYLCIAGQPELLDALTRSLGASPAGMLMSSVFLQEGSRQHRLEAKLARFLGAENGVMAQSGWAANVGLIQTVAEPGVPVYLDMLAHASLWEGVQSARANGVAFLHNHVANLARQLERHGAGVIVVDALYSTNGSIAPLHEIVALAESSGSILIVDESHSLGTHGPRGAGLVAAMGLQERVHFRTASLAKAFAGRAGFLTCSNRFKGYFLSASRPAIFSSCLLEHELTWFDAALDFIAAADDRRATLHATARRVREGLSDLGYNVSDGSEQIIALEAGTEPQVLALRKALERRGVYGAVFCAPATAKNRALLRLTLNSGVTAAQAQRLLQACADIRSELDVSAWSSTRRLRRDHAVGP